MSFRIGWVRCPVFSCFASVFIIPFYLLRKRLYHGCQIFQNCSQIYIPLPPATDNYLRSTDFFVVFATSVIFYKNDLEIPNFPNEKPPWNHYFQGDHMVTMGVCLRTHHERNHVRFPLIPSTLGLIPKCSPSPVTYVCVLRNQPE
jgi:hypothetical protein